MGGAFELLLEFARERGLIKAGRRETGTCPAAVYFPLGGF
jgi:hypothetical protein